jgi:hypothetical protein
LLAALGCCFSEVHEISKKAGSAAAGVFE